jgi:hypothetical protein
MKNRTPVRSDPHAPDGQQPVLAFTPVARRYRHDGWTAERQRAFIRALAETGSVSHAAQRINMAKEGAYQLRLAPDGDSFRAAWAAALDYGVQCLADLAIDRARDGVAVPIFHKGEQVGEKRWYNDRLLQFVLRHHMPDRYGAQIGGGTRSKARIEQEAKENCPVCRAAREREDKENSQEAKERWLGDILNRYMLKVQQEYQERRAGRWYAADFYMRQLVHIELMLEMGGRTKDMLDCYTRDTSGSYPVELYASPLSELVAKERAAFWARMDGLPRPPMRFPRQVPCSAIGSGDTKPAREAARRAAADRIAAAQDEWEAARDDESWAAWCAGR